MLSQEKIDLIKQLYNEGLSKSEISKKTGVARQTIRKYVQEIDETKVDPMINKTFGQLTVLSLAPKRKDLSSRCLRYVCKCSCGNIIEVDGGALRSGHTTSCGCSRKGINLKDLTGQRFGLLTVLQLSYVNEDRRAVWKCKCDCGNIIEATSHSLLSEKILSCGCIRQSNGEYRIQQILDELSIPYIREYRIKECKNINPLPFDFAIFDNNNTLLCLIEYQGNIHFKSSSGWNTPETLKDRQERDKIKKLYCQSNNINRNTIYRL